MQLQPGGAAAGFFKYIFYFSGVPLDGRANRPLSVNDGAICVMTSIFWASLAEVPGSDPKSRVRLPALAIFREEPGRVITAGDQTGKLKLHLSPVANRGTATKIPNW